ncbi:MAG: 3'-5' exonuclease, partial [Gammaproteobacteria bacterium]|nr:3'-5' exonuclease [Gammaproteobacteria bacterium]
MFNSPILVFDIETVPDVASGRTALELDGIDDQDVVRAMSHRRRQKTGGSDFLALHYHRIVAIAVVLKEDDGFRVWSLGDTDSTEKELLDRFFSGIERYDPTLVSWNGSGFDLPVIHYRALYNSVVSKRYWETGDTDKEFKWNNYVNRFHWRHIDLMDVLSGFQARA